MPYFGAKFYRKSDLPFQFVSLLEKQEFNSWYRLKEMENNMKDMQADMERQMEMKRMLMYAELREQEKEMRRQQFIMKAKMDQELQSMEREMAETERKFAVNVEMEKAKLEAAYSLDLQRHAALCKVSKTQERMIKGRFERFNVVTATNWNKTLQYDRVESDYIKRLHQIEIGQVNPPKANIHCGLLGYRGQEDVINYSCVYDSNSK